MMNRVNYVLRKRYLTKPRKYNTLSGIPPNNNENTIIILSGLFMYYIYKKIQY